MIDINLMVNSLFPKEVKKSITIDDIRIKSNLTTNKTFGFSEKSFFYSILGSIESHSGELGDLPGFVQTIPGTYNSDKPMNITGVDKFIENVIVYKDL